MLHTILLLRAHILPHRKQSPNITRGVWNAQGLYCTWVHGGQPFFHAVPPAVYFAPDYPAQIQRQKFQIQRKSSVNYPKIHRKVDSCVPPLVNIKITSFADHRGFVQRPLTTFNQFTLVHITIDDCKQIPDQET
uniref:Uncharacterized protein n=1 Tax=Eutreptiella gymnastica TaxID=73025 RepID=A0A7S4LH39_9EUGL